MEIKKKVEMKAYKILLICILGMFTACNNGKSVYINHQKYSRDTRSKQESIPIRLGAMSLCRFYRLPNYKIYNNTAAKVAMRFGLVETQHTIDFAKFCNENGFKDKEFRNYLERSIGVWLNAGNRNSACLTLLFSMPEVSSRKSFKGKKPKAYFKQFGGRIRWAPSDSSYIFVDPSIPFDARRNQMTYEYFCYKTAKTLQEIFQYNPNIAYKRVSYKLGNENWYIFECARTHKNKQGKWVIGKAPIRYKVAMTRAGMRGLKRALIPSQKWQGDLKKLDVLDCPADTYFADLDCVGPRSGTIPWVDDDADVNRQNGTDWFYKMAEEFSKEAEETRERYNNSDIGISQLFFNAVSVHPYRFRYVGPYEKLVAFRGNGREWGPPITFLESLKWVREYLKTYRKYGMPQRMGITEFGYPQLPRIDVFDTYRLESIRTTEEWGAYLAGKGYKKESAFINYRDYIPSYWHALPDTIKARQRPIAGDPQKIKRWFKNVFAKPGERFNSPTMFYPSVSERRAARLLIEYLHIMKKWNEEYKNCPIISAHWFRFSTFMHYNITNGWHYYGLIHNPHRPEGVLTGTSGLDFGCWLSPAAITGLCLIENKKTRLFPSHKWETIPFQSGYDKDIAAEYASFIVPTGKYTISLSGKYPNTVKKIRGANDAYFRYIPWNFGKDARKLVKGTRDLYLFKIKDTLPFFTNDKPEPILIWSPLKETKEWSGRIKKGEYLVITENPSFWSENRYNYKWGYPSGYTWGTIKIKRDE